MKKCFIVVLFCILCGSAFANTKIMLLDETGVAYGVEQTNNHPIVKIDSESEINVTNVIDVSNSTNINVHLVNNQGDPLELDDSFRALMTVDIEHHEVHEGDHYELKNWIDLSAGAAGTFSLVTPDTAKNAHIQYVFMAEKEMELTAYEGAETSAVGSAISTFNNRRDAGDNAGMLLYASPTVTNFGTALWATKLGSTTRAGGTIGSGEEWVLKSNTVYVLVASNVSAQTAWFDYKIRWYEHTDKD